MDDLLITLITSFYLNLARNEENIDYLLQLNIFEKLKNIKELQESALCYSNTIFAKLLRYERSHEKCIEEKGYELFIAILKEGDKHKFLFLETLDSIKLLLTKRKNLKIFKEIPQHVKFYDSKELNVSFL